MNNILPGNQESPQSNRRLGEKKPPLNPLKKRQKPQISSIPGVSPKERNRYQVMIGDEVIAARLTSDEAFEVAKQGGAR